MLLAFAAFWRILQTQTVAHVISNRASAYISKYVSSDVVFEKVSFNLFPPGLNLHNVSFKSNYGKIKEIELDFSVMSLRVNPIDLFSRKLTISEVRLMNGVVKINDDKLEEDYYKKDLSIFSYFKEKFAHLPNTPDPQWLVKLKEIPQAEELSRILKEAFPIVVQSLALENILITRNQDQINLKGIEAHLTKHNLDLYFHLEGLNIAPFTNQYFKETVNELSGGIRYYQDNVKVSSLTVKTGINSLTSFGFIRKIGKNLKKISPELDYRALVSLTKVSEYSTIHDVLGVEEGAGEIKGKYRGLLFSPEITTHVVLTNYISNLADAKFIEADLSFDRKAIRILKGELKSDQQYLKIEKPFELYNLEKDRMVATPIVATFSNLPTFNILKSLQSVMQPFHAEVSGRMEISHEAPVFIFKGLSTLDLKKFALVFDSKDTKKPMTLISHPELKISEPTFRYAYEQGRFFVKSNLIANATNLKVEGYIDQNEVNVKALDSQLSFNELKEIAGLKVAGISKMDIIINGPLDDVHFFFKGPVDHFEFLDYKLGTVTSDLDFSLKNLDLKMNSSTGNYKNTVYEAKGGIDLNTMAMGFDVDVKKTTYNDAMEVLNPLTNGLWFMPDEVNGEIVSRVKVGGFANPEKMKIQGTVNSKRLVFRGENFKSMSYRFNYEDNLFTMNDIMLFKEIGLYRGKFSYDRISEDFWVEGNIEQISLDEFTVIRSSPLLLNGNLWGNIEGGRKNKHLDFKGSLNLKNSSVNNYRMDNSKFIFDVDQNLLTFELSMIGDSIHSNGSVFLEGNSTNRSSVNFDTNVTNPTGIFLAFFGKYLDIDNMNGTLKSRGHLEFDTKNFWDLNFDMSFDDWTVFLNNKRYSILEKQSYVNIEHGQIEKLAMKMTGPGTLLRLEGKGNLKSDYGVQGEFNLDASIFESLVKGMVASNGRIFNSFKIGKKTNSFDLDFSSKSDDLFLHFDKIPTIFNRIKYNLYATEDRLNIEKFEANLNSGTMKLLGDVFFTPSHPRLNLTYALEDASFNYLGKTNITLTGRGELTGDAPPYLLSGELGLVTANVFNELDDFSNKDSYATESVKFLPQKKGVVNKDWLKYDVNLETVNPIYIKNSMAELSLVGNVLLKGTTNTPRLGGRLSAIPGGSRFYFKSNDFILSRGIILFFEEENQINPDLDFLASSTIAEYGINMRIYGRAKNFNLDLTSEPALAQVDILSLITLGYTNDLSSNLGSGDRTAVTSAGIGGLLFDRFKINEGLKNSFGVKLSLAPEFREGGAGGNMLQGRGNTSTGSTGVNVRSGTKVELRKKVSESVDLAVSSTVGSNIGSKQSMNLNYSFNKNVGAEGVYEIRTNDEGIEDVVATSLGGDLKFKWSFK